MEIGVITNPNSRKNRLAPERADRLRHIVEGHGQIFQTETLEEVKPILRKFLRDGVRFWVADGGDGALHWVLRLGMEVLEEEEFAGKNLALPFTLPTKGGTIDFIANNVGLRGGSEEILEDLCEALEAGTPIEEVEVDSMLIDGTQIVGGESIPFRTYGFAVAAGGVGQRFFTKYYEHEDPNPKTVVKVVAQTVASLPVAYSPFKNVPFLSRELRTYAADLFKPTPCQVTLDGTILDTTEFTGIHIASMSINLGNIFKVFNKADCDGKLHAILGSPSPATVLRNLPRLSLGQDVKGKDLIDRECYELSMAATTDELLAPVIDGEIYEDVQNIRFSLGPRIRIPRIVQTAE